MFKAIILVGCGGFIGAALRFLCGICATRFLAQNFAYATLFVNILGSFLIGFLMNFLQYAKFESELNLKLFFVTGILGAFTTFSAFSYETISFFQAGRYEIGFLNIFANLILSLLFCYFGIFLATKFG